MPKSLYPAKKGGAKIPPMLILYLLIIILFIIAIALAIACTSPYNMSWA